MENHAESGPQHRCFLFSKMNRLTQCIDRFVQTIPVDDGMPSELAHTLQDIYRNRALDVTQRSIEQWLLRVSQTYGVDCEWLEGDWDQFLHHADGKRTAIQFEADDEDSSDDMNLDDPPPENKRKKISPKDVPSNKGRMVKIVTRWNAAIARFVHVETGMVFLSKDEPKVVAHWDGETLNALCPDDLDVCRIYRFQTDPRRFAEVVASQASSTSSQASQATQAATASSESFCELGQS